MRSDIFLQKSTTKLCSYLKKPEIATLCADCIPSRRLEFVSFG